MGKINQKFLEVSTRYESGFQKANAFGSLLKLYAPGLLYLLVHKHWKSRYWRYCRLFCINPWNFWIHDRRNCWAGTIYFKKRSLNTVPFSAKKGEEGPRSLICWIGKFSRAFKLHVHFSPVLRAAISVYFIVLIIFERKWWRRFFSSAPINNYERKTGASTLSFIWASF